MFSRLGARVSTKAFSRTQFTRSFASETCLRDRIAALLPEKREAIRKLSKEHGSVKVGDITVGGIVGGMRGMTGMVWDTSLLDAKDGIRFRGLSIPECQAQLTKAPGHAMNDGEPLPEAMLWLLMTGEVPTPEQTASLQAELHTRSELPAHVEPLIRSLPKGMHSMTQLTIGLMAMQTESVFAKKYSEGMSKMDYWEPTLEDSLNIIARLPRLAALIYAHSFGDGSLPDHDSSLDYSANFNRMLGFPAQGKPQGVASAADGFDELMRLYIVVHTDHEGGNVSAHTTHLVGSALSDAYLSLGAGLNGLAGPLHGLANQEVLKWTLQFQENIKKQGKEVNADTVAEQAWVTLNGGAVIPGFGHAVLRETDPRYMIQREFALKHLPEDDLFKTVSLLFDVIPKVLLEHGKTKNPYPNVDAHSGCLLQHYGFSDYEYYTVLFGVSRAFGVLSQLTWDRALGMPLERPKSVTTQWLLDHVAKQQ